MHRTYIRVYVIPLFGELCSAHKAHEMELEEIFTTFVRRMRTREQGDQILEQRKG